MRCKYFYLCTSANTWNFTHCYGESESWVKSHSSLIILKNNCTDNSSSKVHLFTKFKLGVKWNILASFTKKTGRGDFSDKADFLQMCSFLLFFLFEITACSLVVTSWETTVSWGWGGRTQAVFPSGSSPVPTSGSRDSLLLLTP